MDIFFEAFLELVPEGKYKSLGIILIFFYFALWQLLKFLKEKGYPSYIRTSIVLSTHAILIVSLNLIYFEETKVYIMALIIFVLSCGLFFSKFLKNIFVFKKIRLYSSERNHQYSLIKAWEKLSILSEKTLTPKQLTKYRRLKILLLIKLGNLSAVDNLLKFFKDNKPFYHYCQFMKYYIMGYINRAHDEIKLADEACNSDTSLDLYFQILINRAVGYNNRGKYNLAEERLVRARQIYLEKNIDNKEVIHIFYHNLILNKLYMENDSWKDSLEEFKSEINMSDPHDYISYINIKLEILRQLNVNREEVEKFIDGVFYNVKNLKFPDSNKKYFMSSMARVTWSARTNPFKFIHELEADLDGIDGLEMPGKYNLYKNLQLLFLDLHGKGMGNYYKFEKKIYDYMSKQASSDLGNYLIALPKEAILDRAFCYLELAGLHKEIEDYKLETVLMYLENTIDLYDENFLDLEGQICRLNIVDELCDPRNLNEDYKFLDSQQVVSYLEEVEEFLPLLEKHAVLAEFYLRLGFYYLILDNYEKNLFYYKKFEELNISLNHFAPCIHNYYMITSLSVRALYLLDAIERIATSKKLNAYDLDLQAWFRNFPNNDGEIISILLGKFLGYHDKVFLKRKTWFNPNNPKNGELERHTWLWIEEFQLNIDLVYSQFKGDSYKNIIFFIKDRHPLEAVTSEKLYVDMYSSGIRVKGIELGWKSEDDLSDDKIKLYKGILSLIMVSISDSCPDVERIREIYKDRIVKINH